MDYIDKINKDNIDYQIKDSEAARSVDGDASHVQEANEIYTTTSQSQTDAFSYRTSAGSMSINSGIATISTVYGNTVLDGYSEGVIGTIKIATPSSFRATGFNQYNATVGYAHVVGGNQYRVAGTYTAVEFAATPTGAKTTVTVVDNKFTPEEDGYIFVTGSGDILVALVWSGTMDSEPWSAYSDSIVAIPTVDASGNQLPTATYGMPSVGDVRDELDFGEKVYVQRVGYYEYSEANLAIVKAMGVDYVYDYEQILYALPDPVTHTLATTISGGYIVNDYGTEEWTGTNVPLTTVITYGNSLVDKLRNLADIQSVGSGLILGSNGELSSASGARILTRDDYNYPANNPDSIALWLLEEGEYRVDNYLANKPEYGSKYNPNIRRWNGDFKQNVSMNFIVRNASLANQQYTKVLYFYHSPTTAYIGEIVTVYAVNGGKIWDWQVLRKSDINNNLTSVNPGYALDATQGKILKDLIDTRVPAPTIADVDKFLKGDGTWGEAGASYQYYTEIDTEEAGLEHHEAKISVLGEGVENTITVTSGDDGDTTINSIEMISGTSETLGADANTHLVMSPNEYSVTSTTEDDGDTFTGTFVMDGEKTEMHRILDKESVTDKEAYIGIYQDWLNMNLEVVLTALSADTVTASVTVKDGEVDIDGDSVLVNGNPVPYIEVTNVDPGEGQPIAENTFIAVY